MSQLHAFRTSRVEIADAVADAFGRRAVDKEDLIEHAREQHASGEVLLALASLPEGKRFAGMRELWPDLPYVPVEA